MCILIFFIRCLFLLQLYLAVYAFFHLKTALNKPAFASLKRNCGEKEAPGNVLFAFSLIQLQCAALPLISRSL